MCYFLLNISLILLLVLCQNCRSLRIDSHNGSVRVNKCCEPNEILVNLRCIDANQTNEGILNAFHLNWRQFVLIYSLFYRICYFLCLDVWSPIFTGYDGKPNKQVPGFWFAVGIPQCSQKQMWPIYYYPTSRDRLALLPDGRLRHYILNTEDDESDAFAAADDIQETTMQYDYEQGQYCMDKVQ